MSTLNRSKKMGRPHIDSEAVNVRLERRDLERIDTLVETKRLKGRPEAIRQLVRKALDSTP